MEARRTQPQRVGPRCCVAQFKGVTIYRVFYSNGFPGSWGSWWPWGGLENVKE